jgi:hypothetical protein
MIQSRLKELMRHIEDHGVDGAYSVYNHAYNNKISFECMWDKSPKVKMWKFRMKDSNSPEWAMFNYDTLHKVPFNLYQFESKLLHKTLVSTYYHSMVVKEAMKIVSEEEMKKASEEIDNFKNALINTIGKVLKKKDLEKKKGGLRLIEGGK